MPLANLAVGGGKMIMDGKIYERGIGNFNDSYAIEVPSHGAIMLKIGRAK